MANVEIKNVEEFKRAISDCALSNGSSDRNTRSALRSILREVYPPSKRTSDDEVLAAARAVGGAFRVSEVAKACGCSSKRVRELVTSAGARQVFGGIFEFSQD